MTSTKKVDLFDDQPEKSRPSLYHPSHPLTPLTSFPHPSPLPFPSPLSPGGGGAGEGRGGGEGGARGEEREGARRPHHHPAPPRAATTRWGG